MNRFFAYWFPLIVYSALIFTLSSFDVPPTAISGGFKSYILHLFEFFVLAVLALRAFSNTQYPFLYSFVFAAIFGVLDEVHQSFVPGRMFSYLDMLSDAVGALFVMLFRSQRMQVLLGLKENIG